MICIGIDPGLAHCGFAALTAERQLILADARVSPGADRVGDTQLRTAEMLEWIWRRIGVVLAELGRKQLERDDLVVVEWPVVGGRRPNAPKCPACGSSRGSSDAGAAMTFAAAGAAIGMLRGCTDTLLAPVPVSWRAVVAGGRASAEDVHAQLEHDHQVAARLGRTKAPHALDACGLAEYGLRTMTPPPAANASPQLSIAQN